MTLRGHNAIATVKDKYHMISPMIRTQSTKQTSEQNRTRDMEIKNKLTVTRGEGDNGGKKGKGPVKEPVSYTHLTLPTTGSLCRSRWSPYH